MSTAVLAVLALLGVVGTVTGDWRSYLALSSVPPRVDHFLSAVRAATPPQATVLVADRFANNLLYIRALYLLAPRRQFLLKIRPADIRTGALSYTWQDLQHQARHYGARFIVFYSIPVPASRKMGTGWEAPALRPGQIPPSAVRLRDGEGTLVEIVP